MFIWGQTVPLTSTLPAFYPSNISFCIQTSLCTTLISHSYYSLFPIAFHYLCFLYYSLIYFLLVSPPTTKRQNFTHKARLNCNVNVLWWIWIYQQNYSHEKKIKTNFTIGKEENLLENVNKWTVKYLKKHNKTKSNNSFIGKR